jgi:hypothetical protein
MSLFAQPRQRVDGAGAAADVQENAHHFTL